MAIHPRHDSQSLKFFVDLYQGWVKVGEIVGLVNSRIIMFVIFVTIFAPAGMLFRLRRRDVLHKRFDEQAETYFINRDTQPGSMRNQS